MVAVTICLSIAFISLLVSMVLTTLSSSSYQKADPTNGQRYYIWSMVTAGLAAILLLVGIILYLTASPVVRT